MIAKHDADLALELLVQTRPAKITELLFKASDPNAKQDGGMMNYNPDQGRVRQEIALEQQFAMLAAEQNPDKAIKLIKESLGKRNFLECSAAASKTSSERREKSDFFSR
jgi:hypothetical protein